MAAAVWLALPARAFATPLSGSERDRALFEIARRELDKAGDAIWRKDVVGIADFGLHSSMPRFHFVNLEREEVRSFRVAHGLGSDYEHDGFLKRFSNTEGSNATSRGAYVTWEWYTGRYGTSVRLGGLDQTNSNAFDRAIVMHPAAYAEPEHVEKFGRLGRSNGCFALSHEDFRTALLTLSGGRLLYADVLGLGPDGTREPMPQSLAMLAADYPQRTADRINPGTF